MREEELRSGAAKRRTFTDGTWDYLRDRGYVSEALDQSFEEEAVQYIVDEIDALAEAYPYERFRVPSGEVDANNLAQELEDSDAEPGDYFEVELGDYETERKRAHAEVLARFASKEKEVIEFRRDFLGGKLLTAEQAYTFLESPATRYFGLDFLEAWEIPLIEHKAEMVEYDGGWEKPEIDHRVSVRVDPPGTVKRAQYAPHWVPAVGDGTIRKVCSYADRERTQAKHPNERPLTYRDREGFKATVYPWPLSVLDELRWRCNRLARLYSWEEEDMAWVFLTGEAPRLPALKMQVKYTQSGPRITLTAVPWISAEVVKRSFEKTQKHILVKNPRELPWRSLAVLRFVEKVIRTEGERPPWIELLSRWNMDYPQWSYEGWRGFAQTYRRTLDNVAHSPVRFPQTRPSPRVQKRVREVRERIMRALEDHIEKHGNTWLGENERQRQGHS
jgi:hypothetical protein